MTPGDVQETVMDVESVIDGVPVSVIGYGM